MSRIEKVERFTCECGCVTENPDIIKLIRKTGLCPKCGDGKKEGKENGQLIRVYQDG